MPESSKIKQISSNFFKKATKSTAYRGVQLVLETHRPAQRFCKGGTKFRVAHGRIRRCEQRRQQRTTGSFAQTLSLLLRGVFSSSTDRRKTLSNTCAMTRIILKYYISKFVSHMDTREGVRSQRAARTRRRAPPRASAPQARVPGGKQVKQRESPKHETIPNHSTERYSELSVSLLPLKRHWKPDRSESDAKLPSAKCSAEIPKENAAGQP